jgi:uncharacterized membrane protein YdcZ (DUF606 family)
MYTIYLLIFILIIAAWNGYVILWKTTKTQEKSKAYSKLWHKIGFITRALVIGTAVIFASVTTGFTLTNCIMIATLVIVGQLLYDFVINLVRWIEAKAPPLFYVDNKGFNKFFLKFMSDKTYWIVRFAISLVLIIVLFLI